MWGEKTVNVEGTMVIEDIGNGLKALIIFSKKNEEYLGRLYKYNPKLNL
jgi:hypothetical protein